MLTMRILIVFIMILICAVSDYKTGYINISVILFLSIINFVYGILSPNKPGTDAIWFHLYGVLPGAILLLYSKLKGGIGEGDGYLFIAIGMILGIEFAVKLMISSFVLSGLYALYRIKKDKLDRKMTFPFVPFVLAGYLICTSVEALQ